MRLTAFTDYSLRVLIRLALEPDRRFTVGRLAADWRISVHHLNKVVRFLAGQGLLRTMRGKGGGVMLARPAADINVGEVVRQSEAGHVPVECFDPARNTCVISPACRLSAVIAEAQDAFYATLGRYSLADLVQGPDRAARLRELLRIDLAA